MRKTRWFSRYRCPVREGIYEASGGGWSYFDGEHWNGCWLTKETARDNARWFAEYDHEGRYFSEWRGLAEKP